MYTLIPSLPAQSFQELATLADALKGVATELQVDIVDGLFVPVTSWPFTEKDPEAALAKLVSLSAQYQIEIDCMVREPRQYLDQFVELGVSRVIVHMGSANDFTPIWSHAEAYGYTLGLAFTNDVSLDEVITYIDRFDYVQIMGIQEVGEQGQPFDERTLDTARTLREKYPNLEIAVDGSVNAETIPKLKTSGVNRFAPGSAIAKQRDPKAAYEALWALVNE